MDEFWRDKHYSHFSHRSCEFFPCHQGVDADSFNCLFCYCPLYLMGDQCGGRFTYTDSGVKDCTSCTIPHRPENYGYITQKLSEAAARQSRKR
ncbi:cysteine-rich small domain-containing protein [Oscillibacter sp.]|jgi:Zn-finger protein|uniref:cysteine-rich small domain-containing protein n=1 Tax=Oscillibacter sp. TaxID=1945593 RepID=UPI00216F802C|nr:cysteine-rich small domain-containing protein [Oscillibacter sp.]MCI9648401.1 metal-binding protein [Oscillibacter sp.]